MMKKNLLRMLSAVPVALMLLGCVVSCGKAQDPNVSGTTTVSPTEQTNATTTISAVPGEPVKLSGEPFELTSDFVLVSGDNQNDAILILANTLKNKIKEKTGITLSMGYAHSPKEKEIVLGYHKDRNECNSAYSAIGGDDYIVYTEGSRVVLGAWTKENLTAAADMLLENALVQEGDRWMIYPYAIKASANVSVGTDLSQYRIVYAEGAGSYLKETVVPYLQQTLKNQFGVDVPAVSDKEPASEYEIVLGDTNRSTETIKGYFNDGNKLTTYGHAIVPDGSRVYLLSKSDFALYSASSTLCKQATPEIGPDVFCLGSEPWFSPAPDTDDVVELAEGADIRVMSYNILHPSWGNVAIDGRDTNVANILMYYMPDVVGIQETNAGWHNALGDLLVETGMYAPACQKNNAKSYNMTTMLYNTQTVKLVEEFVIDLDKNSEIRVFAVAIFEKLSDGKRFIVTNTHPAPTGQAENYARNFADMMRISTEQMEKYKDIPVIQTGDFNTKEQSAMYKTYMESTNLKDAKYEADVLVRDYCTYSGFGNAPKPGNANCIDHIFVNSKVDVKLFNVVIDHDVAHTSDHIPIYADIALK